MNETQNSNALIGWDGLVRRIKYKPDWKFDIRGIGGEQRLLEISLYTTDPIVGLPRLITHQFPLPPSHSANWYSYEDEPRMVRWLFDCIVSVERHEAREFFHLDGERIYFPNHGPNASMADLYGMP